MLDAAYVTVVGAVGLLLTILLTYLYASRTSKMQKRGSVKDTTRIPGLESMGSEQENMSVIEKHGSLMEFLSWLHRKFGPIAKFWYGRHFVVSVASPELLKEIGKLFDRPDLFLKSVEALIGPRSVQYANGTEGRNRRRIYDKCYGHAMIMDFLPIIQKHSATLIKRWGAFPRGQHIECNEEGGLFMMKIVVENTLGSNFLLDENQLRELVRACRTSENDMEERLLNSSKDSQKGFENAKRLIYSTVMEAVDQRRRGLIPQYGGKPLDAMLENNLPDEVIASDLVTFLFAGILTSFRSFTLCLGMIASRPTVQEKIHQEVNTVLGTDGPVTSSNIADLIYTRQVIDEVLRLKMVSTPSRCSDTDIVLDGYTIPGGTPIVAALNVVCQDTKIWQNPNEFNPDRFCRKPEKNRQNLSFEPFGLGKRKCPGYRLANAELVTVLANIIRSFKINIVEGEEVKVTFGVTGHSEGEIWITLTKRNA